MGQFIYYIMLLLKVNLLSEWNSWSGQNYWRYS